MCYCRPRTKSCRQFPTKAVDRSLSTAFFICKTLKKIECYIREADVPILVQALSKTGVGGISVFPVQGFGKQKGQGTGALMPKMKVEVFTLDIETEYVLGTILDVTQSGKFGDGKIAIIPVDDVIRIRTGEKGAKAVF